MTDALHNIAPPGSLAALDLEHLLHPVTPLPAHHEKGPSLRVRAEGVYIYDEHGKQYLEGLAGLWCTALGYGEEELVRVASESMRNLSYAQLFGGVSHEPAIRLAEKLKSMMPFPAGRVFFGLSGSDANDTQIKAHVVLPQSDRQTRKEEDHRARRRLSRHHDRQWQPDRPAAVSQALRPADSPRYCAH